MDKRQEVIDKLKEFHNVQCPKCKCLEFRKRSTELVTISVDEDAVTDDYVSYLGAEVYTCNQCGRKLKESEMG